MSGFTLTVTNAGRAALVNAANNGTAPVLMASVGVSASEVTPTLDAPPCQAKLNASPPFRAMR